MRRSRNMPDFGLRTMLNDLYSPIGVILMDICQQCISLERNNVSIPTFWFLTSSIRLPPPFHLGVMLKSPLTLKLELMIV